MENLLTTNMIMVAILVCLLGQLIKSLGFDKVPEKVRKIVLPIILMVIGVGAMLSIEYFNHGNQYGTRALQGLFSSIFSQFIYDKYKDFRYTKKEDKCVDES